MNTEYPSNSHKFKAAQKQAAAERQRAEKVVGGKVTTKKKSGISNLKNIFISEDAKNVKSYIFMDVIIPTIKRAIVDGIDMFLNGNTRSRDSRGSGVSRVSYVNYYDKRNDYASEPRSRGGFDYEELGFDHRGDAEAVLRQLDEMLDRYKMVSVADLYDSAGLTAPYTAYKYGWTDLGSARIVRGRDGRYVIDLPRALPID